MKIHLRSWLVTSILTAAALLMGCAPVSVDQPPVPVPPSAVAQQRVLEPFAPPEPPRLIRVGLATDVESIKFPRSGEPYLISPQQGSAWRTMRGFTIEAPLQGAEVRWTIQVSAMAGEPSAEELAAELRDRGAGPSRVGFDGASGLYRVYAGDFATEAAAREARELLLSAGYPRDMFVTRRPALVEIPERLVIVDDEGDELVASSREVRIYPAGEFFVPVGERTYRGSIIVRVNDRGLLNVINALGLEDYVRGVVPNEMGPAVYDQVAALEAQAIAARTYAISRMGQFMTEGFDICATPACQVYGGHSTEHPLSDRAVANTAGIIAVYDGEPIDALYSSTCGGHTSDVEVMFPGRSEPYLRGVECVELELGRVDGRFNSPVLDGMAVRARIFRNMADLAEDARHTPSSVERSVQRAADLAGFALVETSRLRAVSLRQILRYLGTALDLESAARLLLLEEDVRYFYPSAASLSPEHWTAAFINKFIRHPSLPVDGIDLNQEMSRDELHALLFSWLERQGMVQQTRGKVHSATRGGIELETEGERVAYSVPSGIPIFRELLDRYREQPLIPWLEGDRVIVHHDRASRALAITIQANYDGAAFDRTSSFSSWIRSYDADELTESINRRRPISQLARLEIASRDEAGRVERMLVTDANGATFALEGLPIRWGLSVPDNLFAMRESRDPDGTLRYTFYGKGWGHGTGMCQVGAYGMAFTGKTSRDIIEHYYTGATLASID